MSQRSLIQRTSLDELNAGLAECFDQMTLLRVSSRGRFRAYARSLERAAQSFKQRVPKAKPWLGSTEADALFLEATSQVTQLVDSLSLWKRAPEAAASSLKRVCKGKPLPDSTVSETKDDDPRNVLAELACAAAMERIGFKCTLPKDGHDVTASLGDFGTFVVEAKRPMTHNGLAGCAKKVREQLKGPAVSGVYGLPVIVADRMIGLSEGRVISNFDVLSEVVWRELRSVVRTIQQPKYRLSTVADIGAVLVTGPVFCVEPNLVVSTSVMGFFQTGSGTTPRSQMLQARLSRMMDIDASL